MAPRNTYSRVQFCAVFIRHFVIFLEILLALNLVHAYNIAPSASFVAQIPVTSPRESYFGYSVGLLKTNRGIWLLAGAPRANSSASPTVFEPGTLFKCPVHQPTSKCKEVILDDTGNFRRHPNIHSKSIRNSSWTGASMDIDEEGNVLVCAPRWTNAFYWNEYRISGLCYNIGPDLSDYDATILAPLTAKDEQIYEIKPRVGVYFYAHGQCGMDVHVTKSKELLIGSPGVLNWQGMSIKYSRKPNNPNRRLNKGSPTVEYGKGFLENPIHTQNLHDFNLFGYSVASGTFFKTGTKEYYVAGAPRGIAGLGMVLVYLFRNGIKQPLYIRYIRQGTQLGEYFGSSIVVADFNGNGVDDLVVGAPLHSLDGPYDVGCVYVFKNSHPGKLSNTGDKLTGDSSSGSRFGTALGTPGDLDMDGFQDLLVGAPYENDFRGAVYVFMGSESGIREKYAQKLLPAEVSSTVVPLKGFGISFSRSVDVDSNSYPDIAIGSFLSDSAALMLTRPVINVVGDVSSESKKLTLDQQHFTVIPCIFYNGIGAPPSAEFNAKISLTQEASSGDIVAAFSDSGSTEKELEYTALLNQKSCKSLRVNLKASVSNAQNPIVVKMNYSLKTQEKIKPEHPIMSPFASNEPSLVLSFITGCENDICHSDLQTFVKFRGFELNNTLIIGSMDKITLEVEVLNKDDPAFLPNVTLTLPNYLVLLPTIHDCVIDRKTNDSNVVCQLKNPLKKFEMDLLTFDLDASNMNDKSPTIRIPVFADSATDEEMNPEDNSEIAVLEVEKRASLKVTGWSRPEQITYQRLNEYVIKSNGTIDIEHVFSVEKTDVTALDEIMIEVSVPKGLLLDKEIPVITNIQNELTFHTKTQTCSIELSGPFQPNDFSSNEELRNQEKVVLSSINCSSKKVKCDVIRCYVGPWQRSYDIASLNVKFNFNLSTIGKYIPVSKGFSLFSTVAVQVTPHKYIAEINGNVYDTADIETLFQPGSVRAKQIEWWIYLLAVLGGLLLLLLIAFILYKVGFFRRKKKEELKSQQATLISEKDEDEI